MVADVARGRPQGAGARRLHARAPVASACCARSSSPTATRHHRRGPHQPGRGVADAGGGRAARRRGGHGLPDPKLATGSATSTGCSRSSSIFGLIGALVATSPCGSSGAAAPWSEGRRMSGDLVVARRHQGVPAARRCAGGGRPRRHRPARRAGRARLHRRRLRLRQVDPAQHRRRPRRRHRRRGARRRRPRRRARTRPRHGVPGLLAVPVALGRRQRRLRPRVRRLGPDARRPTGRPSCSGSWG